MPRSPTSRVWSEFPLARNDLAQLTPGALKSYDQEQIDQIYARLTAGPIPDGAFDGDLFFPKGISGDRRIREIIGGLSGLRRGRYGQDGTRRQASMARQSVLPRRARAEKPD